MLLSYNWVSEFVEHGLSPEEMAERLTMSGSEVGTIHRVGDEFGELYVGKITAIRQHPEADRLRLATVSLGVDEMEVVCGAPNIETGQHIVFAKPGATLCMTPDSQERSVLKPAKIRGIESAGMVCSERELGIGTRHADGIVVLSQDTAPGTPLAEAMGLVDTIFDIEITPNRGDCLSILGMARELSALTGQPVTLRSDLSNNQQWQQQLRAKQPAVEIEIQATDLCARYAGLSLETANGESPLWMKWRLIQCGMRPVSRIVDITNYVMLELGQPLHAFEQDHIAGQRIIVRRATSGEKLTTLDGKVHQLTEGMLLIADAERSIALAGIMGGENTEVSSDSKRILLEAAHFEPRNNRRTAGDLGLRTDAATRFEKFVDPNLPVLALQRASQLLKQLDPDTEVKSLVDQFPTPTEQRRVTLTQDKASQLLGVLPDLEKIREILVALQFDILDERTDANKWQLEVSVPPFRPDVTEGADLVEEIGRIWGYDKILPRLPVADFPLDGTRYRPSVRLQIAHELRALGYTEALGYSLLSKQFLDQLGYTPDQLLPIDNPLAEFEVMRPDLLPGLLRALQNNYEREKTLRFFEIGRQFSRIAKGQKDLPEQPTYLGAIIMLPEIGEQQDPDGVWQGSERAVLEAKKLLFQLLGEDTCTIEPNNAPDIPDRFHPSRCWRIKTDDKAGIGILAELHPQLLGTLGLDDVRVCYLSLPLESVAKQHSQTKRFQPFSSFPQVQFDISFVIDREHNATSILQTIHAAATKAPLVSADLIDLFRSQDFADSHHSMTWHLVFQATDRTLSDKEVNQAVDQIKQKLTSDFSAQIRETT